MKAKTVVFTALAALAIAGWVPLAAQELTSKEREISAAVDPHIEEALALLEETVNINSGTMNFEGVREVGVVLREEFDALGFETEWVDGALFDRAGHLVARRTGHGPRILLIGHLDTVFEPISPFQTFERLSDSTAKGPGITDMKGGNVIILVALKALRDAGVLDDLSITVVLTGDEERSGDPLSAAREALIEAAHEADIAIGFEDGDGNPETAVIARRGSTGWRLTVTGRPAHSSQVFREDIGAGAIYEASRIVYGFYDELAGEEFLTFNPGMILGGTLVEYDQEEAGGSAFGKSNVIAEHVTVTGDIRTLSLEQLERTRARMREIASQNLPHTSAVIEFDDGYPPLAPTDGNRALLAQLNEVSRALGFGDVAAVDPNRAGAADISFTAGLVDMAMDGLGLMGDGGHTVDEVADLKTLPMQAKRAAVLLFRLGGREGS
ncbi:MAG: M20/M25/M40 family metallo-hydrolase [Gemmatimonadota bacterium]|nr:M20/M25/M40 family metallo-hydrolase [Gemmatimonadota bacterium]